jgi:hypothetical protein
MAIIVFWDVYYVSKECAASIFSYKIRLSQEEVIQVWEEGQPD